MNVAMMTKGSDRYPSIMFMAVNITECAQRLAGIRIFDETVGRVMAQNNGDRKSNNGTLSASPSHFAKGEQDMTLMKVNALQGLLSTCMRRMSPKLAVILIRNPFSK